MVAIASAAWATVVRRFVSNRCGSRVWSITPTDQPSGSSQIVRQGFPSTFMAKAIRRGRGVAQAPPSFSPSLFSWGERARALSCAAVWAIMGLGRWWAMFDTLRRKVLALAAFDSFERMALRYTQL